MAEMVLKGMPLFNGDSEIDQIFKIFRLAPLPSAYKKSSPSCSVLGTPDDHIWPGVTELPDYKPTFPQWGPQPLASVIPRLGEDGYDVLQVRSFERSFWFSAENLTQQSLTYNQAQRISAKRMKRHPWFDSHRELLSKKDLQNERPALAKIGMSNGLISNW